MNASESSPVNTVEEALVLIGICAGTSGANPVQDNNTRILSLALGSPIFPVHIRTMAERVLLLTEKANEHIRKFGIEKSVESAGSVLPCRLKETAFAWAVDMILADNEAEDIEKAFLRYLAAKLNINVEIANKIIEVTVIRNRR